MGLREFQFVPGSPIIGMTNKVSARGRVTRSASGRRAIDTWLRRFLPMHNRFFQSLDLSLIRGDQLEHQEVKSAFSQMCCLRLVVLPAVGWSTSHARNKVAKIFPLACKVRFIT